MDHEPQEGHAGVITLPGNAGCWDYISTDESPYNRFQLRSFRIENNSMNYTPVEYKEEWPSCNCYIYAANKNAGLLNEPCRQSDILFQQRVGVHDLNRLSVREIRSLGCYRYLVIDVSALSGPGGKHNQYGHWIA